jgi:hypothetical protein
LLPTESGIIRTVFGRDAVPPNRHAAFDGRESAMFPDMALSMFRERLNKV